MSSDETLTDAVGRHREMKENDDRLMMYETPRLWHLHLHTSALTYLLVSAQEYQAT